MWSVSSVFIGHSEQGRPVWTVEESRIGAEFVRSGLYVITEVADDIHRHNARIEEKAAKNGMDRVCAELERGNSAEVAAAAAESPEGWETILSKFDMT